MPQLDTDDLPSPVDAPRPARKKRRPNGVLTPAARRTKTGKPRAEVGSRRRGGKQADVKRIARVEALMREGMGDPKVVRMVALEFGVTERTIQSDCTRVWAEWQDALAPERPRRVARAFDNMRRLQKEAEQEARAGIPGARGAAIQAADRANRIEGVYAPDALKLLQGEMEGMQRLSASDIDAEIERELVKMLGDMSPERRSVVLRNVNQYTAAIPASSEERVPWPALSGVGEVDVFKEPYPTVEEPTTQVRAKRALAKRRAAKEQE